MNCYTRFDSRDNRENLGGFISIMVPQNFIWGVAEGRTDANQQKLKLKPKVCFTDNF